MANHSVDMCTRTKCSDLRGHRSAGWMWYTLVYITVGIQCAFARGALAMQDSSDVKIYPNDDVYVRYGDDLELYCSTNKGNASDLDFTLSGISQGTVTIVNTTTIRMLIEKPEKHERQTYYCKNKKTLKNDIISVTVASPPAKVIDFKCISKNFEVLNCSWTTPDLCMETSYTLDMEVHGVTLTPCKASAVENSLKRYCIWNGSSNPRYRQQESTFKFHLKSQNNLGQNNEIFIINHYSIVKPDPPRKLHNVSVGPHSVVLHWSIPNNIQDFLVGGIEHKIEYQIAKIDDTSYFRQVDTTGLPPNNKTYRFNLTGLPYAYMQYGVRVYIKPIRASNEFWSEFSNLVFYTASERPKRPPNMTAGAFFQNSFAKYRKLRVYWKQLEEYEEAGANFTYKVIVKHGSHSDVWFPDKNKGLGILNLENAPLDAMEISVWSFNEQGSSENSSHLYIPPESQTHTPSLNSFTKLAYENGTYELSWFGVGKIDNYSLFWCQHNTSCYGRLDFTTIGGNETKHIINLPRNYRYHFAISANRGLSSSGWTWAQCDISKDEITMYRFPIVFTDHGPPGKSSVELRWSMDCILKEGIIIGYNISYCPVIKTSIWCDETGNEQSIYIKDPKMNVTIENLQPYRTYQFNISLNTIYGLKKLENTTVRITTLEDTPTSPRNLAISNVRNDSLLISWDQPEHLNGHVSKIKYVIFNNKKKVHDDVKYEDNLSPKLRREVKLENLPSFTNFSFTVQACNEGIDSCSEPSSAISLRNCIGAPSKVVNLTIKYTPTHLDWKQPEIPGGTVDLYQIRIIKDGKELPFVNTTDLEYPFVQCEGSVTREIYQVRAVNFDEHKHYGAAADSENVSLPIRKRGDTTIYMYPGEWSETGTVYCDKGSSFFFIFFIIMGVLAIIGAGCGILKGYKKLRKMKDIKPEFPKGLFIVPEKDNKYPFGGLYPPDKEEKPTSDETLLLPSKTTVSTPDLTKNETDNCGSSDHTDSTTLSNISQGPIRRISTSDDDSRSSLHLEEEPPIVDAKNGIQEQSSSSSETESSRENSPYFSDGSFKKNNSTEYGQMSVNPTSGYVESVSAPFRSLAPRKNNITGYVQPVVNPLTEYVESSSAPLKGPAPKKNDVTGYVQPVVNPLTGYVESATAALKSPAPKTAIQPSGSGYVLATLPPGMAPSGILAPTQPPLPSGYVRAEDALARSGINFPQLGPSPTKLFGPESLPTMPTLPPPTKTGADSSYIQLQSLDSLPSHKPTVRNIVPLKPPASSGYVSPGDPVINKHLKNIVSGGQLAEESAILDPTMSPDAYCRFSWSTDPANDNLNSLLGNSPTINSNKN